MGAEKAVAVRSSATAEDLPDASFAGQQDTYLNIRGAEAVLQAVKRCWASLWTARAIGYRARQGIDPDSVALAVVVQELVAADAAGVMFTANPVNGKRGEVVINATWGLGEALVSGAVTPDTLTVEKASGRVLARMTANQASHDRAHRSGTEERAVAAELQEQPVLSDMPRRQSCARWARRSKHITACRWMWNGLWQAASLPLSRPGRSPRCRTNPWIGPRRNPKGSICAAAWSICCPTRSALCLILWVCRFW